MASYEALEPGGHAHLVGKIKDYANRASGTGTTQVADGSVTSAKLSDGVQDTLDEIALSVDPMLKNGLRGTLPEGVLLTADDVYAAPAHEVDVFGKSTQAGTPTPSSPVPILSVDALTLHASADGTTDYGNWPVQIPLSNHIARSLPDGTRDTLTLSYIGPSTEHGGWGVFGVELVQRVGKSDLGDLNWDYYTNGGYQKWGAVVEDSMTSVLTNQKRCTAYIADGARIIGSQLTEGHIYCRSTYTQVLIYESAYENATKQQFAEHVSGVKYTYPLATPITHDLGEVELPVMPNPMTAWADGGSAQPMISVTYERDVNIARANIISALAEIATS